MHFDDLLRHGCSHLFDVHAARRGGDHDRFLRRAVVGDGEINFVFDGGGFIHQYFADRQSLDVHGQDLLCQLLRFIRVLGYFHTAGFATPAYQYL